MDLAARTATPIVGADAASDIAQTVGLDVTRSLGRLREPASFDRWVHRITERRIRDWLRRSRRRQRETPLGDTDIPAVDQTSLDSNAHDALAAALARLGERQQVALALYYVHDLPVAEIAAALRCRRGTIESLLSRGRAALRADDELRAALGYPALDTEDFDDAA